MQLNFFKNKLFLLIFILFFYNNYIVAKNLFKQKENVYLNYKKFLYIKNNFKKKHKKECFSFLKKNKESSKQYLVIIKNTNYIGFLKNNTFNIFYIVKKNDTLYSISKHLHCNFNELLKYNNFHKPYKILIGQKILVDNISIINTKKTNYIIYSDKYKKHILYTSFLNKKLNIANILNKNTSLLEICFIYNKNYNKENYVFSKKNVFSEHWDWPVKNSYMKFFYNYSINNEGIEITGTQGQSIFASANGKVVYIGNIFKNYGKLIIIKHDNNYLSLYGFNKNVFVKLNDQVYKNQKISTMGCSNDNLAKLYFEIRFKGNSINLLNLFPNIKLKNVKI